jgi:tetratricopeptide (TPR) repeat protein
MLSLLTLLTAAWAGPAEDGMACLDVHDLPCAQEIVAHERAAGAGGSALDILEARVRFHEGRFEEAVTLYDKVIESQGPDEHLQRSRDLAADTAEVTKGLIETTRDGVTVLHHPGADRVLVDGVLDCLTAARERIAPLLGGDPPVPVRVEIYPTGAAFVTASGLPAEAVQTTGVIAISKWHRLLITSPRALGRGYSWQDTIVHEWIHLVVSWHSRDQAPVWLQEGIAKSLDMLWREDDYSLPTQAQSALAQGLRDDNFVTFEEMHPSMAFLPSAERTTLAYAQVATMTDFLREQKGPKALVEVLDLVRDGEDAKDAFAEVYNGGDFDAFEAQWREHIAGLDLVQAKLAALPVVLDGAGEEFDADPVLSEREDLAGKARLGDLMALRGHHEAALLYYEQAIPDDEPMGPVLANHTARSLLALEQSREAEQLLRENLELYDEVAANHFLLATLLLDSGRRSEAAAHLLHSAAINPYQTAVHEALIELYTASGDEAQAERHKQYMDILTYRDTVAF